MKNLVGRGKKLIFAVVCAIIQWGIVEEYFEENNTVQLIILRHCSDCLGTVKLLNVGET
jgi:hypothetical protein